VWKRPISEIIGTTSTPDDAAASLPNAITLHANYPNPFREGTSIHYALPRTMHARLVVYDVAGRAVRTLVNGIQERGVRQVTWDGRNAGGYQVSRGMYLVRLEADGTSRNRKMILE